MEINKFAVFMDSVTHIDAEPEERIFSLCKRMNELHGQHMIDRCSKLAEEACEVQQAGSKLEIDLVGGMCVRDLRKDSFEFLWELSDLTANYWQMVFNVAKASDMDFKSFNSLLIGMAMKKQDERILDSAWTPDII